MSRANRNSAAWMAAVAMAVALVANMAAAAPLSVTDRVGRMPVPSAASLVRFYPTQLSSTPSGTVEDQEVWLAKVQGLIAGAPPVLQQSLLMSQTKQEFSANVALLQQMQEGMLKQGALDLTSQAKSGRVPAKALGDSSNLVYRELEPCRIMDTRFASGASGVQGPITGGVLKHIPGYITTGSDWSAYGQTGTLSDCGLNSTYGGSIWATAIVITILNPNFDAFLGVGDVNDLNTILSTVALNYTHGQGLSTLYIVPQGLNTIYFALPAGLSAQIIFDVVGFFHDSDATPLDCTTVSSSSSFFGVVAASCAAGRTLAGGGCQSNSIFDHTYEAFPSGGTTFNCGFWPEAGQTLGSTLTAFGLCCRIPGR
jgi:hypothetical protein